MVHRWRGTVVLTVVLLAVSGLTGVASARPATATDATPPAAGDETTTRHLVVLDREAGDDPATVLADAVADVVGPTLARWLAPVTTHAVLDTTFSSALAGFTVADAGPALLAALQAHPAVEAVETDRAVAVASTSTGLDRIDADRNRSLGIGSGRAVDVDVAVIDTGVAALSDLRVVRRWDCRRGCRRGGTDRDGHGTHVAGIIAARDDGRGAVGVAPGARVWSVKVVDGTGRAGSLADVVAALDLVTRHADRIEVANISLGGPGRSAAMDRAIEGATAAGITVVVAAGNGARDAAAVTPANSPGAITVSAINDTDGAPGGRGSGTCGRDDAFAPYSNHGAVVDVAAPGSCVASLALDGGTQRLSGTSMAAPHVTGAVAQYLALTGLDRSASRPDRVRVGVLRDWTTSQRGPCGFRGGVSDEPMLLLARCGSDAGEAPAADHTPDDRPRRPTTSVRPRRQPRQPLSVATVHLRDGSTLLGGRWVSSTITVARRGARVADALVTWELRTTDGRVVDTETRRTGTNGTVHMQTGGLPAGCYTAVVTSIRLRGHTFDRRTPANERCV